jgi:hypothetical protein
MLAFLDETASVDIGLLTRALDAVVDSWGVRRGDVYVEGRRLAHRSTSQITSPPARDRQAPRQAFLPAGMLVIRARTAKSIAHADLARLAARLNLSLAVLVRERVALDNPTSARDSYIVRVGLVRRAPSVSRQEFDRHWNDHHAPLVLSLKPLFFRYVTNVVVGTTPLDGIVEQWFRDEATWREHDRLVQVAKPAVLADKKRFVGGVHTFITSHIQIAQ